MLSERIKDAVGLIDLHRVLLDVLKLGMVSERRAKLGLNDDGVALWEDNVPHAGLSVVRLIVRPGERVTKGLAFDSSGPCRRYPPLPPCPSRLGSLSHVLQRKGWNQPRAELALSLQLPCRVPPIAGRLPSAGPYTSYPSTCQTLL